MSGGAAHRMSDHTPNTPSGDTSSGDEPRGNGDLLHLLVEQVQDYAIYLINPQGRVATWNAGAERIKGYQAEEIIGQPYATFFTAEDRAAGKPARLLRRAREHGHVEDEGWRVRKDGSRFWADAVLTALHDANGTLRGYAKVTRDLTERRQLEELRTLIQTLQETAEARDQAVAAVEAERTLLQTVLRQLPVGVIVAEAPSGRLILGNEQVELIWRQPFLASASTGDYAQYHAFQPDGTPYQPEQWPLARALVTGEVVSEEEIEILRGDGSHGIILASAAPVRDRQGRIVAAVTTFSDITERKQIEREREQLFAREQVARAEAEAAREQLERFMGALAHDLRSPLTAILASAQIVARTDSLPKRCERAVDVIQRQVRRMSAMIESLVDAARIGGGELQTLPAPMDLIELARQVVEARQVTTTQHQIVLEAPARLAGVWDAAQIERVLDNLIGNALKYSPNGGEVHVQIKRRDGDEDGDEAWICVADQGLGMRPEDLPLLFQLFSRGESARGIEGSGLGLYVARGLVEAHGGRIWAQSAGPGQGSTFCVTLPLAEE